METKLQVAAAVSGSQQHLKL